MQCGGIKIDRGGNEECNVEAKNNLKILRSSQWKFIISLDNFLLKKAETFYTVNIKRSSDQI